VVVLILVLLVLFAVAKLEVGPLIESELIAVTLVSELEADVLSVADELADVVSAEDDDGSTVLWKTLDSMVWELETVVLMLFSVAISVITVESGDVVMLKPELGVTELVMSDTLLDVELCSVDEPEVLESGAGVCVIVLVPSILEVLTPSVVSVDELELASVKLDVVNVP
jgi:hypothetical protein